jgi:hypothetical protein
MCLIASRWFENFYFFIFVLFLWNNKKIKLLLLFRFDIGVCSVKSCYLQINREKGKQVCAVVTILISSCDARQFHFSLHYQPTKKIILFSLTHSLVTFAGFCGQIEAKIVRDLRVNCLLPWINRKINIKHFMTC